MYRPDDSLFLSQQSGSCTVTSVGAAREYRPEELEHVLEVQEQFKTPIEKEMEIEHADDDDADSRQHKLNPIIASKDSSQLGIPFKHRKNYLISNSLKTMICILIATAGVASLVNLVVNGDIIVPNTGIFLPPPSSILNIDIKLNAFSGKGKEYSATTDERFKISIQWNRNQFVNFW